VHRADDGAEDPLPHTTLRPARHAPASFHYHHNARRARARPRRAQAPDATEMRALMLTSMRSLRSAMIAPTRASAGAPGSVPTCA